MSNIICHSEENDKSVDNINNENAKVQNSVQMKGFFETVNQEDVSMISFIFTTIISVGISILNLSLSVFYLDFAFYIFTQFINLQELVIQTQPVVISLIIIIATIQQIFDVKTLIIKVIQGSFIIGLLVASLMIFSSVSFQKTSIAINLLQPLFDLLIINTIQYQSSKKTLYKILFYKTVLIVILILVVYSVQLIQYNNIEYQSLEIIEQKLTETLGGVDSQRQKEQEIVLEIWESDQDIQKAISMLRFIFVSNPQVQCFLLTLFALFYQKFSEESIEISLEEETNMIKKIETIINKFFLAIKFITVVVFIMWIVGSIGSSSLVELEFVFEQVKHGLAFLSVFFAIFLYTVYKIHIDVKSITNYELNENIRDLVEHDMFRAICATFGWPILLFFRILSGIKTRVLVTIYGQTEEDAEYSILHYTLIRNWFQRGSQTNVLNFVVLICIGYFLQNVMVLKVTQVFLSWLNSMSVGWPLWLLLIVQVLIGTAMFLHPLIPGAPVQFIGGLMICNYFHLNQDKPTEEERPLFWFWMGTIVATLCASVIKQFSLAILQFITMQFSDNMYILSEIGAHKTLIRAIGDIFNDPDHKLTQIMCFSSMPDWPMSAMTGLIKLEYVAVQMACFPVIILCFFYCFSGCALVIPTDQWNDISAGTMLATAFIQVVCIYLAYEKISEQIEQKKDQYEDESKLTDLQKKLIEEEQMNQEIAEQHLMCTNLQVMWRIHPVQQQLYIVVLVCMVGTFQAQLFFEQMFFRPFAINSSIDAPFKQVGLEGNALNIVRKPGWIFIIIFLINLVIWYQFRLRTLETIRLQTQSTETKNNQVQMQWHRKKEEEQTNYSQFLGIQDMENSEQVLKHELQIINEIAEETPLNVIKRDTELSIHMRKNSKIQANQTLINLYKKVKKKDKVEEARNELSKIEEVHNSINCKDIEDNESNWDSRKEKDINDDERIEDPKINNLINDKEENGKKV